VSGSPAAPNMKCEEMREETASQEINGRCDPDLGINSGPE
jgi:hypothetical protein